MHFYALFVVVIMRSLPLANDDPKGTGLLQMVIRRGRPLANDDPEGPASCK